jgi:hypothetical protein
VDGQALGGFLFTAFGLLVALFFIYVGWRVFEKADRAGWKVLIPIYSAVVMLRIVGRPTWWIVLFFIPIINLIPTVLIPIDLAKSFGKGTGFGIGLLLLAPIFYPILALGDATYEGPSAADGGTATATA